MRYVRMCIFFLGLITMSCTIPDVPEGECGTDVSLGHNDCQCVASDDGYSNGSNRFTPGKEKELGECRDKQNPFHVTFEDEASEIYVCLQYKCDKAQCKEGTKPDDDNMKCIKQCAPNEINKDDNTCICNTEKNWEGEAGECRCKLGYVEVSGACVKSLEDTCDLIKELYDAKTNTCKCDVSKHFEGEAGSCICKMGYMLTDGACEENRTCGENEHYDDNGTCVCDKGYLRFFDRCIQKDACQSPRVKNGNGTCTCDEGYRYMCGDCFTVGDTVKFGRYPQNKNNSEPLLLTWRILEINKDSALLLSEYVLERYRYHNPPEEITWEWSNVRSYLNGFDHTGNGFIDIAFTSAERRQIKTVTHKNPDAPSDWGSTPGGNDTEDRVFLLSHDEALKYFSTNKLRMASPTAYAIQPPSSSGNLAVCLLECNGNSCTCEDENKDSEGHSVEQCSSDLCTSCWWLRTPGRTKERAAYIDYVGVPQHTVVNRGFLGLRPALYLLLNAE